MADRQDRPWTGNLRPGLVRQTRASFDFQWSNLQPGTWSPAHAEYLEKVPDFISEITQLEREWFVGKDVLDAGCGPGRHAFGFCRLGARLTAVDQSPAALRATRSGCAAFSNLRGVVVADLLHPLPVAGSFDLVWSYGVLHHTGDTRTAFKNIADCVRPGGYLFVMLYGEPRSAHPEDGKYRAALERWRQRCSEMSFDEKVGALRKVVRHEGDLLAYFDAISPWINDVSGADELRAWFAAEGFVDVRRRVDEMDHYLMARRPVRLST